MNREPGTVAPKSGTTGPGSLSFDFFGVFSMRPIFFTFLFFFVTVVVNGQTPQRSVVELGFPILTAEGLPKPIDLRKPQTIESAFLLQIRRQAVLIAAREELGAVTRDAFLDETAPEDAVRIPDVAEFPNADLQYVDHTQFVAELERLSRNEFVAELEKRGVKKAGPSEADKPSDDGDDSIEKLLTNWALVPQVEAVRRTHEAVRLQGESLPLLKLLVRGYTQLQILTNIAPRDTHRVFQARAILYAQRAVAKYGETPETLSLRAAAWSLNNFHRLAREEFAAINSEGTEAWIKLAQLYADFDIKGLAEKIDAADFATEKGLASLLYFMLLDYSNNTQPLARRFGEKAIADLPDCARFYQGVFGINTFDVIQSPDGSPFYEHLARRLVPPLRRMRGLPGEVREPVGLLAETVNPRPGGLLGGLFGGRTASQSFPIQEFFLDLANVLKALVATTPTNDSGEPSFQALATLITDEQFATVRLLSWHHRNRNSAAERIVEPAKPVLEDHPIFEFLAISYRDRAATMLFWDRLVIKDIPYNLLSMQSPGMAGQKRETRNRLLYSPPYAACLFADMENVRDVRLYYGQTINDLAENQHYFLIDVFERLCPKNPYIIAIRIERNNKLSPADVEMLRKEFGEYPIVSNALFRYCEKNELTDKLLEYLLAAFDDEPTYDLFIRLVDVYLNDSKPDKAIEIATKYMESPNSQVQLSHAAAAQRIGRILLQQGKFAEATPYIIMAARTGSGWGLSWLGQYYEIIGQFDNAEKLYIANRQSYPEGGPFSLWAFNYCTNGPNLDQLTGEVQERFTQFMMPGVAAKTINRMERYQGIYPCYCLGLPYPEQLGRDPLYSEMLRSNNGIIGFLAWFEIMEQENRSRANGVFRRVRDLATMSPKVNPDDAPQQRVVYWNPNKEKFADAYQKLATLFTVDQRAEKPGNLDSAEIDFLLRSSFTNELKTGEMPQLLYLLGRYYDLCEQPEKANEYFRRVLAVRADFDGLLRCLVVRELRDIGMTNDEYVKYSQGDPKFPRFKISSTTADVLCRQHFRVYTDSPSATVLARPAAAEPIAATDFGKTTAWASGMYRVTKILFRGTAVPAKETDVYWRVPSENDPENADWSTHGIAFVGPLATQTEPKRDDGTYPLQFGKKEPVSASASFHGNRLALTLTLQPGEELIRLEMIKVAELAKTEEPVPTESGITGPGS